MWFSVVKMLVSVGLSVARHYSRKSSNKIDDIAVREASNVIKKAFSEKLNK
jgi:hypothetical protein